MKEAPVKRGDVLAGKYRVESVLGVGGMGVVVAATHLDLLEIRAIKLMLPRALASADAVERFLREARASSRLVSEHVARVHDVGRLEDGAPYMVMEHLEGTDLRALLKQRGRIPVAEAVLYALQACEALAEAHARGIVHRDLKPANLFLTARRDGSPCVKVLDFGISKVRGPGDPEMTTTQAVMGSPTYMSPEQMRSARSVDARTDIWSLGVILYRLVTGDLPFQADNITELIALVLSTSPVPPSTLVPDLPHGFDEVLARCLTRDLARRFQNVGELADALLPFAPAEGRGSVLRIARLLEDAPSTRSTPPTHRLRGPRGATGTLFPWVGAPAGERISIGRWAFVALGGGALGLAVAGAVALAVSVRLHARGAAAEVEPAQEAPPPPAAVAAAPPVLPPPPAPSAAETSSACVVEPAPAKPAESTAVWLRPRPAPSRARGAKRPPEAPVVEAEPEPAPAPAATAPHRMFGIDE